jgi:hypothetical protein
MSSFNDLSNGYSDCSDVLVMISHLLIRVYTHALMFSIFSIINGGLLTCMRSNPSFYKYRIYVPGHISTLCQVLGRMYYRVKRQDNDFFNTCTDIYIFTLNDKKNLDSRVLTS